MTPKEFERYFASMSVSMNRAVQGGDLAKVAANEAARLFRQNFREEGFFGKKWDEVQRRKTHEVRYKTHSGKIKTRTVKRGKGVMGSRKILTGATGNLGRSIRTRVNGNSAIVYSDLPYSVTHNEGTNNAGRGHHTRIAQRKFIGEHPTVTAAMKTKIEEYLNRIIKQ
jgi:phage gpG-like protein